MIKQFNRFLLQFIFISASSAFSVSGDYRLNILVQKEILPVLINIDKNKIKLFNSNEILTYDLIELGENKFQVNFDSYLNRIEFEVMKTGGLKGIWFKSNGVSAKPFDEFEFTGLKINEKSRFALSKKSILKNNFPKYWKVSFYHKGILEKKAEAIFNINQKTGLIQGSILTSTGDYRFLEGYVESEEIFLYGFDGRFNFIIKGSFKNSKINAQIISGKKWRRSLVFEPIKNLSKDKSESLTQFKRSSEKIILKNLEGLNGEKISLADKEFQNKPVIIQVFGSWCSNCHDEFNFLQNWLNHNTNKIKVLSLGFEKARTKKYAQKILQDFKKKYNHKDIHFVLASHNKDEVKVEDVLTFIKKHVSYPTMIFLDKNHKLVKIHTGFAGPAALEKFQQFSRNFNQTINELI